MGACGRAGVGWAGGRLPWLMQGATWENGAARHGRLWERGCGVGVEGRLPWLMQASRPPTDARSDQLFADEFDCQVCPVIFDGPRGHFPSPRPPVGAAGQSKRIPPNTQAA